MDQFWQGFAAGGGWGLTCGLAIALIVALAWRRAPTPSEPRESVQRQAPGYLKAAP